MMVSCWRSFTTLVAVSFALVTSSLAHAQVKELELKACGSTEHELRYAAGTDKSRHPTPAQPVDKALIYVLRPTMVGDKVQSKVAVDGEWRGVNRGNNYLFFTLDPGEHRFCSVSENRSVLTLQVEAGKTYYLQQHIEPGFTKARNRIERMTDEEGRKKLASLNLATWAVK